MWPFRKKVDVSTFQFPLNVKDYSRAEFTAFWEIMLEPSARNGHSTVKWTARIVSNLDMLVKEAMTGIATAAAPAEAELAARQASQQWVFSRMSFYRVGG